MRCAPVREVHPKNWWEVGLRNRCEMGGWPKQNGRWGLEEEGFNTNYTNNITNDVNNITTRQLHRATDVQNYN